MLNKTKSIAVSIFLITSILAGNAFGCACCSEPGTYAIWNGKPQSYEMDILKQIKFEKRASLFMTEAGFDGITGLSSIEKDFFDSSTNAAEGDFDLTHSFAGRVWTLTFKTVKGKTGTLRLPMPAQMSTFRADIHDGSDQGLGPLLYKEFRFKGTVASGSGFLGKSIVGPTTYFLVFQGRGHACDDVGDFRNWNLEISGKKASYQFYGKLENITDQNALLKMPRAALLTLQ
jgi:hypothetical protein